MLRLGQTYQVDQLRQEAVHRLSEEFPSTLDAWNTLSQHSWEQIQQPDKDKDYLALYVECANLARETGLTRLLPATFMETYHSFPLKEILRGVARPGGTLALSAENQQAHILGIEAMRTAYYQETFRYLDDHTLPSQGCTNLVSCKKFKMERKAEEWAPSRHLDVLQTWEESWGDRLCKKCAIVAEEKHNEGRRLVWAKLPSYFDLPPWEELNL